MSRRFWGSLAMAAGILATVHGTAMAQQQDASAASRIKEIVETCFSPPPGAMEKAIVSATFDAYGSLRDKPEVVRKGEGPINNTFANAAVRAILSCEPRLAGLGLQGKITFNFDPPDMSPGNPPAN